MDPVVGVALLCSMFVGSHVLLATSSVRGWLVRRLGDTGFAVVYSLIAWGTFGAGLFYFDQHRLEGPPGLHAPWMVWPAIVTSVVGLVLVVSIVSPSGYAESPSAIFPGEVDEPRGIERITRHPQFAGIALFGLGHCLLAQSMVGVVYFGSFVVLGFGGGAHQDRKLRARRGEAYADYLRKTSSVPFVAILRGRQRLVLRELPWVFVAVGLGLAWWLRSMHGSGFEYAAQAIFVSFIVGPVVLTVGSFFKHRSRS